MNRRRSSGGSARDWSISPLVGVGGARHHGRAGAMVERVARPRAMDEPPARTLVEIDRQIEALLHEQLGIGLAAYLALMGPHAFHPNALLSLPANVLDSAEFLARLKGRERELRSAREEERALKRAAEKMGARVANIENEELSASSTLHGELERLHLAHASAQAQDRIANARLELWQLSRSVRIVDADLFHARAQELLEIRLTMALIDMQHEATDLCAARADRNEPSTLCLQDTLSPEI